MLFWIYNLTIVFTLPFIAISFAIKAVFYKKRPFFTWFYPKITNPCGDKTIWIHAVSLGEVNTAKSLIAELKRVYCDYKIYLSTSTDTGFLSASKIKEVSCFYLPLDFWLLQKRVIERINPCFMIYIEGDVWPSINHLLNKKRVAQYLVSAKLSERSLNRLMKYPKIANLLYGSFTGIFVQDELMKTRFTSLKLADVDIRVGGNLKLSLIMDHDVSHVKGLQKFLDLDPLKKTLVISCTHQGEELLILNRLKDVLASFNVILAPRHPQRFHSCFETLVSSGFNFRRLSDPQKTSHTMYYIDKIGVLAPIYKQADVVILGGSFVPEVGGHNVMEPILCGAPCIVGPYMHSQLGPLGIMLENQLGLSSQIVDLEKTIIRVLNDPGVKNRIANFCESKPDPAKKIVAMIQEKTS